MKSGQEQTGWVVELVRSIRGKRKREAFFFPRKKDAVAYSKAVVNQESNLIQIWEPFEVFHGVPVERRSR